jgi:hypothetical protein
MKQIAYIVGPKDSFTYSLSQIRENLTMEKIEITTIDILAYEIQTKVARIILLRKGGIYDGMYFDEAFGVYDPEIDKRVRGERFRGGMCDYLHSLELKQNMQVKTFGIKKVIFNDPATIVLWEDGTKTVVKAQDEDFDAEKGLAMAISKKALGNQGNYCNEIKKWTEPYNKETAEFKAFLEFFTKPVGPTPIELAYDALRSIQYPKTTKPIMKQRIDLAIKYLKEALED